MSTEVIIVFPMIIIILASFLWSFCLIAERAFYDYEDGVTFLLSVPKDSLTEINRYGGRVELTEEAHITGKTLSYQGRKSQFRYFKPSRLFYSVIFGN